MRDPYLHLKACCVWVPKAPFIHGHTAQLETIGRIAAKPKALSPRGSMCGQTVLKMNISQMTIIYHRKNVLGPWWILGNEPLKEDSSMFQSVLLLEDLYCILSCGSLQK